MIAPAPARRAAPDNNRFGNARRVWPPAHVQIAHPSIGVAALVNGGRFRARASFRDMIKGRGVAGGGGGGSDEKDDAVSKLIDKYGDQMGEVGFGGVVGFCRCLYTSKHQCTYIIKKHTADFFSSMFSPKCQRGLLLCIHPTCEKQKYIGSSEKIDPGGLVVGASAFFWIFLPK